MRMDYLVGSAMLMSMSSSAISIQVGEPLPSVQLTKRGELSLLNDIVEYDKWSSDSLTEKIRFVQHLAGTLSAKKVNLAFTNKLTTAQTQGYLPERFYQTTSIINLNESLLGTKRFVSGAIENNKRQSPESSFVIDETGAIKKNWQLEQNSSAMIALNEKGKVIFFKEGQLSDDETNKLLDRLINETKRLSQKGKGSSAAD